MLNSLEKHKIIIDKKEEIIKLYNDGTPIRQIAHKYNLAFWTIWHYLVEWGIRKKNKRETKVKREYIPIQRKFSPELQKMMEYNTQVNNRYIEYISTKGDKDREYIANILYQD